MCGQFNFTGEGTPPQIEEALRILQEKGIFVKTGVVSPGDVAAVLASNRQKDPSLFAMRWGYKTADGKLLFNARSETAHVKPTFSDGMLQRRCLIPADSYFEWQRTGNTKQKYSISPVGMNFFFLAGIYRLEQNSPVFSVLTRQPDPSVLFIHDRMPVILPAEFMKDWLNPDYNGRELLSEAFTQMQYCAC